MPEAETEPTLIHDGHTILECNDAACELFRCACGALAGMQMAHIVHDPDLRQLAILRGKRIMSQPDDKTHTMEYTFRRCDGSVFWGRSFSRRIGREPDRYETRIKWQYDDWE